MEFSQTQLAQLNDDGFLKIPSLFTSAEANAFSDRLPRLLGDSHPANVVEKASGEVRTAMALQQRDPLFAQLISDPRLVVPALQIRCEPLYVQQVKVNVKKAFSGEIWQWHYDFATHHRDDGVPKPLALNLHIFLDDVSEHNGPLYFIPGSHRFGTHQAYHDTVTTSYPLWVVDNELVTSLVKKADQQSPGRGIVSATGPKGTALVFFDTTVHGSPNNMSPSDRAIFSLILNPVSNALTQITRPDHKHHRDLTPVAIKTR